MNGDTARRCRPHEAATIIRDQVSVANDTLARGIENHLMANDS